MKSDFIDKKIAGATEATPAILPVRQCTIKNKYLIF